MSIRTILACLTTEAGCEALTRSGAILGRRFGAHLTGLHVMEAMPVYAGTGMYVPAPIIEPYNTAQREAASAVEAAFRRGAGGDLEAEWRVIQANWTTASDVMVESARAADLVLMSRAEPGSRHGEQRTLQDAMIRGSGRPVLVLPGGEVGETLGRCVLVGWSATREATRAVHDALMLMEEGAEVHLLRVAGATPDEMTDHASNDLAAALARHGARLTVTHRDRGAHTVVDVLLREAREVGADMIVTGAFGHSRAYDFVVGAATSELLGAATLPVLYAK